MIRQIKERRYNYYLELKIWKRRIKINEKILVVEDDISVKEF